MSDFLNFLNTAELETLTKVPGVTRALAGNVIAARPFDSVEDCLKAHGMGKNLLARMESFYAEGKFAALQEAQPEENRAMVAVENAPIEKSPPRLEEPKPEEKPSFLTRLGIAFVHFLKALLKFILTLAFFGSVGALLYFGLPYLNETLIAPAERNAANIQTLEKQVADLQSQLDGMNARMSAVEQTIESQSARIARLEEMQATLEEEMSAQNNSVMTALKREVVYARAVETLARARLYLAQSNFGLAKQDVKSARSLLASLWSGAPEYQLPALDSILARLDLALENLPAFPVIASNDLEIAWELLMLGLPQSAEEARPTPTPSPEPTFTPTPFAETTPTPIP